VTRLVFVCTANTARSQLAAALWKQASDIPATSAGTHPAESIAPGALRVAARHDLDLPEARPRHLADVVTDHDLVVTVCDNAHEELATRPDSTAGPDPGGADAARVRRLHWSVADPVPTGDPAAFDTAYDDLARRVTQLTPRLVAF
jgi:protein-tyrosine-phosphatase